MLRPRQPSIFHDKSWSTPWISSEFPPEETIGERVKRQDAKSEWKSVPRFLYFQSRQPGGWPWGWAIYRTSYVDTSDEDWASAIGKLDQACLAGLEFYENSWSRTGRTCIEWVREGYRNVIFEDSTLEGASEGEIRCRHKKWVEDQDLELPSAVPRLDYPLLLDDRCVRSILASAEPRKPHIMQSEPPWQLVADRPGGMVGYVNVVDPDFDTESPEIEEFGKYYSGLVRLHLDCLFKFVCCCEGLMTDQDWGYWGMESPAGMVYTDGHSTTVKMNKETFLSSPDQVVQRTATITELEYNEHE